MFSAMQQWVKKQSCSPLERINFCGACQTFIKQYLPRGDA